MEYKFWSEPFDGECQISTNLQDGHTLLRWFLSSQIYKNKFTMVDFQKVRQGHTEQLLQLHHSMANVKF